MMKRGNKTARRKLCRALVQRILHSVAIVKWTGSNLGLDEAFYGG